MQRLLFRAGGGIVKVQFPLRGWTLTLRACAHSVRVKRKIRLFALRACAEFCDSSSVSRAKARADSSPLRAYRCTIIPKQLARTSCTSLFSRTLDPKGSNIRPISTQKQKNHSESGSFVLEREKGLLAISPRFAAACQLFGLALPAFASSAKFASTGFAHESNYAAPLLGSSSKLRYKKENHLSRWFFYFRAGKGTRTLDPDLGKVVLYQLSYSREVTQL